MGNFGLKYRNFKYKYNNKELTCPIRVEQCETRTIELYTDDSEYNGEWTNKIIKVKLSDAEDNCSGVFKIKMDETEIDNNGSIIPDVDGVYKEKLKIEYYLEGEKSNAVEKSIQYDGASPDVKLGTKVGNLYTLKLIDEGSGLKSYQCNNDNEIDISNDAKEISNDTYQAIISVNNSCNKITVSDNVGNSKTYDIDYSNFASIQISPINEYEFKVIFENYKDLDKININYNYDETKAISKEYSVVNNEVIVNVFDYLETCSDDDHYECKSQLKNEFTNNFVLNFNIKNGDNILNNFKIKFNMSLYEYSSINKNSSIKGSYIRLLGINEHGDVLLLNYNEWGRDDNLYDYYIYSKNYNEIYKIYLYYQPSNSMYVSSYKKNGEYCYKDISWTQQTFSPQKKLIYNFENENIIMEELALTTILCEASGRTNRYSYILSKSIYTYNINNKNSNTEKYVTNYNYISYKLKKYKNDVLLSDLSDIYSREGYKLTRDYYNNAHSISSNKSYPNSETLNEIRYKYKNIYNIIKYNDGSDYEKLYNPSVIINNANILDNYSEELSNGYKIIFFVNFDYYIGRSYLNYLYYKNLEVVY